MRKELLLLAPLLAGMFLFGAWATSLGPDLQQSPNDRLHYNSYVCADVTRSDGTVEKGSCSSNFFTPAGKNTVMYALGTGIPIGAGSHNVSTIEMCNISTGGTGTFTCYNANGFSNQTGTFLGNVGGQDGNWSLSTTFTATQDGMTMNGTMLLNGTAVGSRVFANNTFTAVTLNTNDAITLRWNISIA